MQKSSLIFKISIAATVLLTMTAVTIISNLSRSPEAPRPPKPETLFPKQGGPARVLETEWTTEKAEGILYPGRSSGLFQRRAQEFFFSGEKCEFRFFMTWIAPAEAFRRREVLAVESLFGAHPRGCLMIISESLDSESGRAVLRPLVRQGFRVIAAAPDLSFLFEDTPAMDWLRDVRSGKTSGGTVPLAQNLSNLLRLAVLYKYGGVYLDTDFLALKPFAALRNSIGAQSADASGRWSRLNNAVLIFDKAHPLLYRFMEEFVSSYDGSRWGHNGPYLISRVVEQEENRAGMAYNVTVLPPTAFYPVDWIGVKRFFGRPGDEAASEWVEAKLRHLRRETYGVHLWNRESGKLEIEEGSVIGRLISHK